MIKHFKNSFYSRRMAPSRTEKSRNKLKLLQSIQLCNIIPKWLQDLNEELSTPQYFNTLVTLKGTISGSDG